MARPEGQPTPSNSPSTPDRFPRLSRRSLLKGAAGAAGVAVAHELTGRPLLPSGAEAHEVIPREPQTGSEPMVPVKPTSPLDKFIQKGTAAAQSGIGAIRKELAVLAGKPAAAHGLDQKTTKSTTVAAVGRRAVELGSSSMINNVETFGNEQALTDTEMRQLIENLNARVGALSPEERAAMMRSDTYYGTMFISETAYRAFFTDNGETFQTFLRRHEIEMRRMLKDAQPSIVSGMTDPTRDERGFIMRRVVVVRDGVTPPASHHLGYLSNGIKDSDGTFNIPHPQLAIVNGIYKPRNSGYWDNDKKIDKTLLHEMGHQIFHFNDQYALDIGTSSSIPAFLRGRIPQFWQKYFARYRSDISPNDIMVSGRYHNLWYYSSWQLHRRRNHHDFNKTLQDLNGWPAELPQKVTMKFKQNNGQEVKPDMIEVYRTRGTGNGYEKVLMDTPAYSGSANGINPHNLFETNQDGLIVDTGATLLVKVVGNGREYFRWMDVRDFNLAHWTTGNAGVVTMDMKVIATDDTTTTPESFDWTIRSSTKRSLIPLIPRLFTGLSN